MKRFKNILYISDGTSIHLGGSAEKVASLARLNDARITVIISDETTIFDDLSLKISGRYAEMKKAIQEQNVENLHQFISHERWRGVDIHASTAETNDFISIIRSVLQHKYDLVIKEETLDQGIDQLAMRLVRKCPCPVWIMKQDSGNFRKILAAVDVAENYPESIALNQKIIELTYSLAQREKGEAHYLHVWRLEHEAMMSGPRFKVSAQEISEMKKEIRSNRMSQLHELLGNIHLSLNDGNIHLREGRSEDVIKQAINELNVDVLVMGSVARSGIPGLLIGNKAEKLLSTINCTVLTVKPDGFVSPVTLN
ncbi:universal stress protein [Desulforhopalus sp. 52FAK]